MLYSPYKHYNEVFNDSNKHLLNFKTFGLSEIPEFNQFIDAVNSNGTVNLNNVSSNISSLTDIDFETNSNGNSVYNIPFNCQIGEALHNSEANDLTLFAFSYIDFKIAFESGAFEGYNPDSPGWGHLLPINNKWWDTPNILQLTAKQSELIEYFMDHGYSMPVMKQVLKNNKPYHSAKAFGY